MSFTTANQLFNLVVAPINSVVLQKNTGRGFFQHSTLSKTGTQFLKRIIHKSNSMLLGGMHTKKTESKKYAYSSYRRNIVRLLYFNHHLRLHIFTPRTLIHASSHSHLNCYSALGLYSLGFICCSPYLRNM